jgi:hypothetical protein
VVVAGVLEDRASQGGRCEHAKAKERLQEIVRDFPDTKAAAEAKELLEKLKDEE